MLEAYAHSVMNTFGPPKRVFVRGEGCYVWDADGRRHLDLLAGIAVNALGHAHPTVLAAVTGQISTLGHVSNFFATPAQVALATRLAGLTGDPDAKVFFTNSGTEANEAAFKITRMTGRTKIISTEGAFHGRSMGALAITHNPKYRAPFEPLPGDVTFVPYGDVEALAAVVDETVAAVVLEPIQGENGVLVPPEGYLARARELCDAAGALLWIDEVQTGMGRTGLLARAHRAGRRAPTWSRWPRGSATASRSAPASPPGRAARLLGPGSHGSTFGGNPVAAIAGLAVHQRHRARRPARARDRDGRAPRPAVEGLRPPARRRGPRPRPAARDRADRRRRAGRLRPRARGRVRDQRAAPARAAASPRR